MIFDVTLKFSRTLLMNVAIESPCKLEIMNARNSPIDWVLVKDVLQSNMIIGNFSRIDWVLVEDVI